MRGNRITAPASRTAAFPQEIMDMHYKDTLCSSEWRNDVSVVSPMVKNVSDSV